MHDERVAVSLEILLDSNVFVKSDMMAEGLSAD